MGLYVGISGMVTFKAAENIREMVAALARSEIVHINVTNREMERNAREFLQSAEAEGEIFFHHFPTKKLSLGR